MERSVWILRPFLEVNRFTIRMDHECLKFILNLPDGRDRLDRWHLRLSEFY